MEEEKWSYELNAEHCTVVSSYHVCDFKRSSPSLGLSVFVHEAQLTTDIIDKQKK